MKEVFKKGMVMQLNPDDQMSYVVIDVVEYNGEQYLILNEFDEKTNEIEVTLEKILLIKVKEDLDYEYVKDVELAKKIVNKILS